MNRHVQIREIPEETHRKLKARAAAEGLSMSDYLKRLIELESLKPCGAIFDEERSIAIGPLTPCETSRTWKSSAARTRLCAPASGTCAKI